MTLILFESDVPETTRALVDLYSDSDDVSTGHVVLTYDIECEMESGLPDPQRSKESTYFYGHFMILQMIIGFW